MDMNFVSMYLQGHVNQIHENKVFNFVLTTCTCWNVFFPFLWLNLIHTNECDLHTNQLPTLLRHALDIISLLPCVLYLSLYFVWTKTYMHMQIILKLFILAQLRP